ncbi:thioredoxin domain-containing protein 15 [Elysia marginata]|uniref:Thioredoxin domain-containing protein 15 n=1 Tax=Elysia marginata TaxID=1093978 RepID=A0AAV4ENV0_9GAST|nr:thioredoxin domain-containing protein 15 [Elysia marginata]
MTTVQIYQRCYTLMLVCLIILANLALPNKVEATTENADIEKDRCNGVPCEESDSSIEPSRNILLGVTDLEPSLDNDKVTFSSGKDEIVSITSDENTLPKKNSYDIKHGSGDSALDQQGLSADIPSDNKDSIEIVDSLTTTTHSDSSKAQDLSNSNSQVKEDPPSLQVIGMKTSDVSRPTGDPKHESEAEPAKHTLFPFLYTSLFSMFKSLLRSFLSELVHHGNQQDIASNTSEGINQSSPVAEEENSTNINVTSNGTDSIKRTRFQCAIKNVTANDVGKVKVVNSTELLDILSLSKSQKSAACVLVMFYAPWCHFCAQTAPHYNALARAFPQLDILAVDTSHFSYLNARFGTVAVPNIMLFHSRSAVRFNYTQRILEKFTHFVTNNTGLEPRRFVLLEPLDFVGPLPCVVKQSRDWLLWLAWVFVAICAAYGFVQSQYGQGFIAKLKFLWQEHQHID